MSMTGRHARSCLSSRSTPLALAPICVVACLLWCRLVSGADVQVAVASNFATPMGRIAVEFTRDVGHHAVVSTGATGSLAAQIRNGAPFDVFLAADSKTPRALESDKLAVPGTRFTVALGRLVLWSARPGYVDPEGSVLERGDFHHVAIANPTLAPYGEAAIETLRALGLGDVVRPKIVQGENVAQTATFIATGNAELGFVALSQVTSPGHTPTGSYWVVPPALYAPIRQDGVLLTRGASNPAARALLDYLKSPKIRDLVRSYGYEVDEADAGAGP